MYRKLMDFLDRNSVPAALMMIFAVAAIFLLENGHQWWGSLFILLAIITPVWTKNYREAKAEEDTRQIGSSR